LGLGFADIANHDALVAWQAERPTETDMKRRSLKELTDNGVPYFVSPDDLRALQIDPDLHFKTGSNGRHNSWAGWMLDRKKDAALIERLQSMHLLHETMQ
jgi:hypothetical protein